jgi:hypothetical protein
MSRSRRRRWLLSAMPSAMPMRMRAAMPVVRAARDR